jgi:hypothetical protein
MTHPTTIIKLLILWILLYQTLFMHYDLRIIVNGIFNYNRLINNQIDMAFAGQNKKKAFNRSRIL